MARRWYVIIIIAAVAAATVAAAVAAHFDALQFSAVLEQPGVRSHGSQTEVAQRHRSKSTIRPCAPGVMNASGQAIEFTSQVGQDRLLFDMFYGGQTDRPMCGGVFVEAGAFDGHYLSNSRFFERHLGWSGLCIEASPISFGRLVKNRPRCTNINAALSDKSGKTVKLVQGDNVCNKVMPENSLSSFEATTVTLTDALAAHQVTHVDFLSLDVEGHEEFVLAGIDWDRVDIDVILIEMNNCRDRAACNRIRLGLSSHGYRLVAMVPSVDDNLDDIWTRIDMSPGFSRP